ncbi:MAG: CpaF family protein [Acidobacteria bacterium]|nr:CpaF family protein [Acidobacteriota bacterium]
MHSDQIFAITIGHYLAPVAGLLADDHVNEIMINGPDEVYLERDGRLELTDIRFHDPLTLEEMARNFAQFTNKRIDAHTARFDSRLPDGSRVHVLMPRCSRKGLCISIRKFSPLGFSLEGMLESGSLTPAAKEYLETMVAIEANIMVSGGTGSGKTSFLNALSLKIPPSERIIVIEDTAELKLGQPHVLSLETAAADRKGRGAVTIRDLFHSALRMRPDRIIIGECRGGEALDLVQALTSGHGGSMSTLHANTGRDALSRLETMALMSGVNVPVGALRPQVAAAVDVVVQLIRLINGRRVVSEIVEVDDLLNGEYQTIPIFERSRSASGRGEWELCAAGRKSIFGAKVQAQGRHRELRHTAAIFGQQGS